jgi:hypothetical protein
VSLFEVIREQVVLEAVADRHLDPVCSGSSLKCRCPYPDHEDEPDQTPTGQLLSSRLTDTSHGYDGEMISH